MLEANYLKKGMVLSRLDFRDDINGLRALAVLAVVIFHFSNEMLPGGFAGVDIFFAISGYLMTSIVFRSCQEKCFSYKNFLYARARRIIPALLVVCLLVIIFGYAILDPKAYITLAIHARDSLLFFSNVTYEGEAGYFNEAAKTKFLLHTWSLSVEWQFYIVYPIVVALILKFFNEKWLVGVVLLLIAISFTLSVLVTKNDAELSYFMLYTRAWEMLAGGGAYLLKRDFPERFRGKLEALGLLIVVSSFFVINEEMAWPGYLAVIPVFGTFLCLVANNPKTILSGVIFNKLGIWSYSIYLIHWPVLAFDHYLGWGIDFKLYFIVTLCIALALHYAIERRRHFGVGFFAAYLLCLFLIWAVLASGGANKRFDIPEASVKSLAGGIASNPGAWIHFNGSGGGEYDAIFYGDSFAAHYGWHLQNRADEAIGILFEWQCLSTPNYYSHSLECKDMYEKLKQQVDGREVKVLVISQAWLTDLTGLKYRENDLAVPVDWESYVKLIHSEISLIKNEFSIGDIIVVGSNYPFVGLNPSECISDKFSSTIYKKIFSQPKCSDAVSHHEVYKGFNALLESYILEKGEFLYFSPNDVFCDESACHQIQNEKSLFSDPWHLSVYGADLIGSELFKFISTLE